MLTPSCLPQATSRAGAVPGHPTLMGRVFSPTSSLLGNLGNSLSVSVLPPDHSPPTMADIQPTPAASPGKDAFFSKPQVNQSETVRNSLLPILYLYGGFLPELAFTHRH